MLNAFAKFLLISTALSPILGAVAVNQFAHGVHWIRCCLWLVAAILLVFACWVLLQYAMKNAQEHLLHIKEFDRKDQEVLVFLLTYLLPFISSENMMFSDDWPTSAYILVIIYLVIAHAGAFHFNPVMGFILGYHFYAVKNDLGVSQLLISKKEFQRPGENVQVVKLAHNIYLQIGNVNA